MAMMNAAVVTSFDEPPHYQQFEVPQPAPATRCSSTCSPSACIRGSAAARAGAHYTSSGTLPMIPGIDGVGRRPDGRRVYFVADDDVIGTMADKAVVDARRSIELPDGADVAKVAAAMNPAMSSWVALRRRVPIEPGQSVLVLGATGNAGTMAVQVAKRLGAGRVVGAGRDPQRLQALPRVGADELVQLTDDARGDRGRARRSGRRGRHRDRLPLGRAGAAGDRWRCSRRGRTAAARSTGSRSARSPARRIELPSVALRSANLRLQGSGQGAVSPEAYLAELPSLVDEIKAGTIAVNARPVALQDVEATWTEKDPPGVRTVLVP